MKFYVFQILNGLVMPSFEDFDYYFTIDILDIKPEWLSLQFVWNGLAILIVPFIYIGSFYDSEYRTLIMLSQVVWIYTRLGKLALAFGWTQAMGLPNFLVYFVTGAMVDPLNHGLLMIPSMVLLMKVIPKGIESTM